MINLKFFHVSFQVLNLRHRALQVFLELWELDVSPKESINSYIE